VQYGICVVMSLEKILAIRMISHVTENKVELAELPQPLQIGPAATSGKVVKYDNLMAFQQQRFRCVTPNETGPPRDYPFHDLSHLVIGSLNSSMQLSPGFVNG
jgi:hypothetical protein